MKRVLLAASHTLCIVGVAALVGAGLAGISHAVRQNPVASLVVLGVACVGVLFIACYNDQKYN